MVTALAACTSTPKPIQDDFAFDGTCVNCHAGLSAGHVHGSFKLRCIDCHGGNDQVDVPPNAFADTSTPLPLYRDPNLVKQAHVVLKDPKLARFFFANGIDDNGDGRVDETVQFDNAANPTKITDFGEVFEPQLHGEGPGEFVDTELNRDLNYTRFLNPGDLRVATVGCGAKNRAGIDGGFGCHQQTIDVVRRGIMVNQAAVTNGAYYGNESWRTAFIAQRGMTPDPRAGAFSYALDYDGADQCIDPPNTADPRSQPKFNSTCLEARSTSQDPAVAANAQGNAGLPAFEIAEGSIGPANGSVAGTTLNQTGANDTDELPWGGNPILDQTAERSKLAPLLNAELIAGIPDPVDVTLRTFRAYYPLNYPGSTNNFDFTFGTSILPDIARFRTGDPFGRGHSSGCSACHAPYAYDGSRQPTPVVQDDGSIVQVTDPTTQHREFHADQDRGMVNGQDRLIGRAVTAQQQSDNSRAQQRTYSANHQITTKIDTDTCGLCHGFVTRINYAYQGAAEDEQRDQLARRKEIDFTTPAGTSVRILDSWVREDNQITPGTPTVVAPAEGLNVIALAEKRDAMLAAQGFIPGNGGCGQNTFSEDCNNDGELETALVLTKHDENGNVTGTITINEDLNGNGKLDLIDRVPREKSIDGRQVRYVYGGHNGSQRQMDVHFERGMACIDCHFLQDVHGDGHVYSTNWDTIEIECEDCHGAKNKATLITSGPNGGNDLTRAVNDDHTPFFERKNGQIIQRSRVVDGLFWVVPQTSDMNTPLAQQSHDDKHMAEPGQGSTFAGMQGQSPLTDAKVECQTCHSSWVHNCMGCHLDLNLGDPQRKTVAADGTITKSAHENETWLSNANNPAHVNFQLLGLMRSPFVMGTGSSSEKGRLAPFRSSMQLLVTITGADGNQFTDNQTFTTFQAVDGNSGRTNVATSAVAMNQTMPHTTRPNESRGCESCHELVDAQGRVRNEHLLAESFGLGTGSYPYAGDWGMAVGQGGLELYEHKQENELAANIKGKSERFPGFIVNPNTRTLANVEPRFDGTTINSTATAVDIALIRNFNPTPVMPGGTEPPTLRDLAVVAVNDGGQGKLLINDITARGRPGQTRPSVGDKTTSFVLNLPAAPTALANLAPDVSDPFVYVAVGASGLSVVRIDDGPSATANAAALVTTVPITGEIATDVALAGDMAYVGTQSGKIFSVSLANPTQPVVGNSLTVDAGHPINDIAIAGFVLYFATQSGVAAVTLDNPAQPAFPDGAGGAPKFAALPTTPTGISVSNGHVFAAAGAVFDIDFRTIAAPAAPVNLATALAPGQPVNAVDVIVSVLPGQTWLLALDVTGDMWGLKLDNRVSPREKCYPNPVTAGCILDMNFVDPTIMQRDPSFDPVAGVFDSPAVDPSSVTFFRQTRTAIGSGTKLARPAVWEAINTLTGRRYRDSFMPGSGTISLGIMQVMRSVKMCESSTPANTTASGLNQLGFAMGATCTPIADKRRPASTCRVLPDGKADCQFGRTFLGPLVGPPPAPTSQKLSVLAPTGAAFAPLAAALRPTVSPVFQAPR